MSHTASSTDPLAWLRDTLQARMVGHLFSKATHDLVLKGGMAMRVLHQAARATKDIDLDADSSLPMQSVQALVRRSIKQAAAGLLDDVVITEPKQTETTLRWKIGGIDPITKQALHLTVEVSRRNHIHQEDVEHVQSQNSLFPRTITVYTSQMLAFTKIKAFVSDTRNAPRDVADLYLLIQAQVKPPIRLLRNWIAEHGAVDLAQMWDKIESMDQKRFDAEVRPSLSPNAQTTVLFSDWDNVRLTVGQHVQAWLELAQQTETEEETDKETEKEHPTCGVRSCH